MASTTPRKDPIDVGAPALPNNNRGQTEGQSYDCPDDAEEIARKRGISWKDAFNDQLTKFLRPDLHRHDHIDDEDVRGDQITADATRQEIALRFTKGEAPAEEYISIIGGNAKYLGCIVIKDIHDLGLRPGE